MLVVKEGHKSLIPSAMDLMLACLKTRASSPVSKDY